jgi:hypothetical protein
VLFVAVLSATLGIAAARAYTSSLPPQLSEAESEAVARAGAARALAAFIAPPGASPSSVEPAGDGGQLAASTFNAPDTTTTTSWWLVTASTSQVLSYLQANPPAGSQVSFSEVFAPASTAPRAVGFRWPEVPRARGALELEVKTVQLPNGVAGLLVRATGRWLRPRPLSEVVPSGARLLRVTVLARAPRNRPPQKPLTITDRAAIERVVTLLNALPVQQPTGPEPCPAGLGISLRMAFYRRAGGHPIATATDDLDPCGGVQLIIAGHTEPGLENEGDLVQEISKAVGAKLDLTPKGL